jgi:hypothetical protein
MPALDDDDLAAGIVVGFSGFDGKRGYWLTPGSRVRLRGLDETPAGAPPPKPNQAGSAVPDPTTTEEDGHDARNRGPGPRQRRPQA